MDNKSGKYDYDAIIIGAGIGGLVCGCYLAKAGLKTLIVEKNSQPGGYCTSFKRGGYVFDSSTHSLGSLRKGGITQGILQELGAENKLKFKRADPSDVIMGPEFKIHIYNDIEKTIKELQGYFPAEKEGIESFFNFVNGEKGGNFGIYGREPFKTILDKYFKNEKLKAIIAFPILCNMGLPPSKASAFGALTIFREFMLDGGYYPGNCMQDFPNALAERFKELGGEIKYLKKAEKIEVEDKKAKGVRLSGDEFISSRYVVSNADTRQTFIDMVDKKYVPENIVKKVNSMEPSVSGFIAYLGMNDDFNNYFFGESAVWFMPNYDIEGMYSNLFSEKFTKTDWFILKESKQRKVLQLFLAMPFINQDYWKKNKEIILENILKQIKNILKNDFSLIKYKEAASPSTLYKWTLNYKGAAYGWAQTPDQFADLEIARASYIDNLYSAGHWTTLAQGTSGAAYIGRNTAKIILSKERT